MLEFDIGNVPVLPFPSPTNRLAATPHHPPETHSILISSNRRPPVPPCHRRSVIFASESHPSPCQAKIECRYFLQPKHRGRWFSRRRTSRAWTRTEADGRGCYRRHVTKERGRTMRKGLFISSSRTVSKELLHSLRRMPVPDDKVWKDCLVAVSGQVAVWRFLLNAMISSV